MEFFNKNDRKAFIAKVKSEGWEFVRTYSEYARKPAIRRVAAKVDNKNPRGYQCAIGNIGHGLFGIGQAPLLQNIAAQGNIHRQLHLQWLAHQRLGARQCDLSRPLGELRQQWAHEDAQSQGQRASLLSGREALVFGGLGGLIG